MIQLKSKGNFSKLDNYFEKIKEAIKIGELDKYGREGVAALAEATPKDTGLTSSSWKYEIIRKDGTVSINFINTNIQNGVPIAVILQYGHGTKNGGWVEGRDYINPAIQPIFDKILTKVWKEVTK